MNVKELWMIVRKKPGADPESWDAAPDLDLLETVRVNGELGLPIFTSREKAEQYIHNEKCLQVEIVQPGDSVVKVSGFLNGMIEWQKLACLVVDPAEARTIASATPAKKFLENIIRELDKHAPPGWPGPQEPDPS
jgi:hypothetical protein